MSKPLIDTPAGGESGSESDRVWYSSCRRYRVLRVLCGGRSAMYIGERRAMSASGLRWQRVVKRRSQRKAIRALQRFMLRKSRPR